MPQSRIATAMRGERASRNATPGLARALSLATVMLAATLVLPTAVLASGLTAVSLPATPTPLPVTMARTYGAQQMVVATGARLGSTDGALHVFNLVGGSWVETLTVPAKFGKKGLIDGLRRKEGSNTTPTGIWRMPGNVFGTHSAAPAGTLMGYRRIDSRSWWSSRRGKTYNAWVEARTWQGERLANSASAYEFAVSTGYNARPNRCIYGRGTAIFLHVSRGRLTAGCVAISRPDMIRVCRLLDPSRHPVFAIGTLQHGKATSIWAY